jgi:predicted PurR-regulated permease PerM
MVHYNPKLALLRSALPFALAVLALAVLGLWLFSNILVYLLVSLVLATILRPLVSSMERTQVLGIRVPRTLAILLSFVLLFLVLTLFVVQFIPLVSDQIQIISELDYTRLYDQVTAPMRFIEDFMQRNRLTQREPGFLTEGLRQAIMDFFNSLEVRSLINSLIGFTGSFFIGLMAVLFITFFFLRQKGLIRSGILALVPNPYFEVSVAAMYKTEKLLSNYLIGLLFQMFSIFSLASLGLSLMGVKYALTIAVFAAVANIIPYAGPILGAGFGVFVAISTSAILPTFDAYLWLVVKIVIIFAGVQLIDNLVLQPVIFSKSVKAHPLEIFLVIFAGASLGGVLGSAVMGMILAVPLYTVLRVTFLEFLKGYSQYRVFKTN